MKRAEEISKAAEKELKDCPYINTSLIGFDFFIKGAKWADSHPHWISVEDRRPKLKHKNENTQYSEKVIVTDGKYRTSASWVHNIWAGWYGWFTDGDEELKGITHWMQISPPPKKED